MGKIDRGSVVRRDDHPHPDPRLVEQLLGKAVGHADAAVRGRIAGQWPAVQCDAIPGDALHVRHPSIVIHAGVMVLVLLEDGKDPGGRFASPDAGRHRCAKYPAIGVVERDLLGLDRYDRHDWLAGIARRRRLFNLRRMGLFGRDVGGRHCQRSHRRERYDRYRPPTPHRHGESSRRQSNNHLLLRLTCLPVLASIKVSEREFSITKRRHVAFHAADSLLRRSARFAAVVL